MSNKVLITNSQKAVKVPSGLRILIRRACNAVLEYEHFDRPAEISVTFVDNAAIAELNNQYRNKPMPTDVLSFPLGENGNKTVTDTCAAFAKAGKKVAAICAAPSVLAALGLLEGKNATAHAAFQDKLAGAHVLDTEVVVDGNITTSYGLGGAIPFALELVRQLAGEAEADRIRSAIAYRH